MDNLKVIDFDVYLNQIVVLLPNQILLCEFKDQNISDFHKIIVSDKIIIDS